MSINKEVIFFKKKEDMRDILFYFVLLASMSSLGLVIADDPGKFCHVMRSSISNNVKFPLFLLLSFIIMASFAFLHLIKKYKIIEKDDPNKPNKPSTDDDPLYEIEIDEDDDCCVYNR